MNRMFVAEPIKKLWIIKVLWFYHKVAQKLISYFSVQGMDDIGLLKLYCWDRNIIIIIIII